jgi:nitric oxide reductase subunit B
MVLSWDLRALAMTDYMNLSRLMLHVQRIQIYSWFGYLTGFMGAAHFIIPDESGREIYSVKLAYIQLVSLIVVGVTAIIGFHLNWWEGRKFLEIPRPLDFLVVINVLTFLFNIGMTVWKGKKFSTTGIVLYLGLLAAALLYLPGMIYFHNQTLDSYFRWWVVHLWVEGVWELIMGSILSYLLIKLTGVDREVIEKWLYVIVGLTFLSGILGTGHHYYFIGTPKYWLWIGGIFSALEPLAFLGMALFAINMYRKSGRVHPNKASLYWTIGCAIMSFVGAGFLGFAHTLPQVNLYTHGDFSYCHAWTSSILGSLCNDSSGYYLLCATAPYGKKALEQYDFSPGILDF